VTSVCLRFPQLRFSLKPEGKLENLFVIMGEGEEDLTYCLAKSWECCSALPGSTQSCDSSAEGCSGSLQTDVSAGAAICSPLSQH